jgi:hypothetical protein
MWASHAPPTMCTPGWTWSPPANAWPQRYSRGCGRPGSACAWSPCFLVPIRTRPAPQHAKPDTLFSHTLTHCPCPLSNHLRWALACAPPHLPSPQPGESAPITIAHLLAVVGRLSRVPHQRYVCCPVSQGRPFVCRGLYAGTAWSDLATLALRPAAIWRSVQSVPTWWFRRASRV